MVKKSKGKHRLDKYYHLAKEQGFRSRAAFKLIQLNKKYNFLSNCRALLDLCAAPGGWMQVAAQAMPLGSLILGVDLAPIKPIRGAKSFVSDITTAQCRQLIKREAAGSLFDVVVHDGAPNVGGAWTSEAYTQSALVVDALALAVEFLAPGGAFISKVFRSKDYNALLYAFGQLFNKVEATKPQASRNASAEIFVVCLGFKAPGKVDPRLLDPKHLFQDMVEAPKVMGPESLLKQKIKQKRHREGYADGLSSTHRALPASAFLLSDAPVEMLGAATRLVLLGPGAEEAPPGPDGAAADAPAGVDLAALAAAIRAHKATDSEVTALCSDLQVLGRSEFKQLLRWRLVLRKALAPLLGVAAAGEGAGGGGSAKRGGRGSGTDGGVKDGGNDDASGSDGEASDPEQRLLTEMASIQERMEQRLRREKRKRREAKKKAKLRAAQLMAGEDGGDAGNAGAPDEEQLFSLGALTPAAAAAAAAAAASGAGAAGAAAAAQQVLHHVAAAAAPGEAELDELEAPGSSDEDAQISDTDSDASSLDSDEAALDYEAELEEQLEEAYASYLSRKGVRDAAAREKRQRLGTGGELGADGDGEVDGSHSDGEDSDEEQQQQRDYTERLQREAALGSEEEEEEVAAEAAAGGGLLVRLDAARAGVARGGAAAAAQWFGQELFEDPDVDVSDADGDADDVGGGRGGSKHAQLLSRPAAAAATTAKERRSRSDTAAGAAAATNDGQQQQQLKSRRAADVARGAMPASVEDADFEVVPQKSSSSGDDDSDDAGGRSSSGEDSDVQEFNELDDTGKAEVLALAKRMLRRKDKESILEAAYNRYAFHDDRLPRWFAEDERRHMRPIPQVTKAEVEEQKARLAAIDARPIKKVVEAKARKQKRMQARLDAARAKATSIAAQEDLPMASKMREIEKLYAKARAGNGAKGGGKKGAKRKGPPLDKRMKKDRRGMERAAKRMGGKKGAGRSKAGGRGGKAGGSRKGGRR